MFSKKSLISEEGFDYLFDLVSSNVVSKTDLERILAELYSDLDADQNRDASPTEKRTDRKLRSEKKENQYSSLIRIITSMDFHGPILEIGCGNGDLSKILAQGHNYSVIGVDQNRDIINRLRSPGSSNYPIFLLPEELKALNPDFELAIGLHCCGNLSDEIIKIGCQNPLDRAAVICVPCCYGKINKKSQILPQSTALKKRKEIFEYIIKRTRFLEGYVDNLKSRPAIILELYRRLIDFDRMFSLNEKGYQTCLLRLTDITGRKSSNYYRDSLMSAIVAKR